MVGSVVTTALSPVPSQGDVDPPSPTPVGKVELKEGSNPALATPPAEVFMMSESPPKSRSKPPGARKALKSKVGSKQLARGGPIDGAQLPTLDQTHSPPEFENLLEIATQIALFKGKVECLNVGAMVIEAIEILFSKEVRAGAFLLPQAPPSS